MSDGHYSQRMKEGNKLRKKLLERSTDTNVLMMDAPTELEKKEYVLGMGQSANDVAVKDVPTSPKMEEYARGMEQRSSQRNAAAKDVQIKLKMEECALGMEQR
mmetsp:Transcript_8122/g.13814  ORF Transcript_8122/g.13814 Transcript_8122/m.13814 type:complete len:103 (+) Transcript_8122:190-498(+)